MVAVAGVTATEATGTSVTVTAALPAFPSLVAVIVAGPTAMLATSPLPLTVATLGLLLDHITVRPVRVPPAESFGVAVSCTVCPTVRLAVAGATATEATEATGTDVTVSAAVLLLPSLVAVIVAEPAATPATRPLPLMVATLGLPLVHVTIRPVSVPPAESFGVAVSCTVCPTVRLAVAGEIATEATGTVVTVSAAVLLLPSLVAVIVAEPAVTPATRPLPLMVATLGLPLVHVTIRPVSVPPAESFGVAVSCTVCPTVRLVVAGEIATEATGTVVTVSVAVLLLPSLVAVIIAEPGVTPATRPLPLTVATLVLLLAHITVRPVRVPPAKSFGVAVSCNVCATRMLPVAGEIVTEATVVSGVPDAGASCPTTGTETPTTTLATAAASVASTLPLGLCASAGVTPGRQVVVGSQVGGTPVAGAPPFTGRTLASRKACGASVAAPVDTLFSSRTSNTLIRPSRVASPNRYPPDGLVPAARLGAAGTVPDTRLLSGATASSSVPRTPSVYPLAVTVKTSVTPVGARPCGFVARILKPP